MHQAPPEPFSFRLACQATEGVCGLGSPASINVETALDGDADGCMVEPLTDNLDRDPGLSAETRMGIA